jgi:hypothetical protein
MSFFSTHDPFAVDIGIRLMRILPLVEKLARVKNSEMFRKRMIELVDTAYDDASRDPTLLKKTKRVVRRELKEAVDGGDVRETRIQAEELYRLDETLYRLELEQKKDCRPGKWRETIRKQFVNDLLDAAEAAGGCLGLDRENGRGTLLEAIKLLRPCLPNGKSQYGLGTSTLKKIIAVRGKKLQKTV